MKMKFYTIDIEGKCFDLPKDMQVPEIGSVVHIEGVSGIVETINYHVVDGVLYMVSIYTSKT